MKKYLTVFKISFAQEFAYPINLIFWRIRNIFQIILLYFLWSSVFENTSGEIFGYSKEKILTYIFGIIVLKAFVFSTKTNDIAGDISRGDLVNYLLKPISYFKYWFSRDIASKSLNLVFSFFEITILFLVLKPQVYIQKDLLDLCIFLFFLLLAVFLFFLILMLTNLITFWAPEAGWSSQFLIIIILSEFFSGAVFPIDILPQFLQRYIYLTPFPYLIFIPLQVYLGKVETLVLYKSILVSFFWIGILIILLKLMWQKGLKRFEGAGR
ncbi:hypothetical protein A2159_00915 [Candidatus Woesebacteria bacterium RBG_13_34_9]|uniref:ABC transporter permease n=1 Tax=Candidatus Woesebacteria bacterium RBG_13_34_9 TaxID=1802477 RepID=A0A1F7X3A6_9BACT|nr:MAG: hypothetical protein A2159_00915 [Candidatus Woesebacteria bacterium RBG_13_34_9]